MSSLSALNVRIEMIMISRITLNLRMAVYGGPNVDEHTRDGVPLALINWKARNVYYNESSIGVRTTVDTEVHSTIQV